jgi:hypothetical protein
MKRNDPSVGAGGPGIQKAMIDGTRHLSICPFLALKAMTFEENSRLAPNEFGRIIEFREAKVAHRRGGR